jgi:radical SAM protein with 4Fe4S-binding SPASM domain
MLIFISKLERKLIEYIKPDRFLPIQLDITNLCNLRCTHCYHPNHNNDGALSLNEWKLVLRQYERILERLQFDPDITICGGEPLLSPLLKPLLEHIRFHQKGDYQLAILTNGTMVNKFDFSMLNEIKNVTFQVSLDGPNSQIHDLIRGAGSFNRSLLGINLILSHGFPVEILTVLSKNNAHLIPDFFNLAKTLGVASMGFTRFITQGAALKLVDSNENRPLEPVELRDAFQRIIFESNRTGVLSSPQKPLFRLLHPKLGRSGRFAEGLVVDHRGNILASSRSRIVLGHVFQEGLETILLEHPLLKAIRQGNVETCGRCQFYQRCGGDRNAAYAYSGDYLGADPGCWLQIQNDLSNSKQGSAG